MSETPSSSGSRRIGLLIAACVAAALLWFREPLLSWWQGASAPAPNAAPVTDDAADANTAIDHYTCSMHPSIHQQSPGTCPICGMTLIPVTRQQASQEIVTIAPTRQQLIGVRTGPVISAPFVRSVRAAGRLTYDESSLTDVTLKVRGYIVKLFASRTGQRVKKGEPLFSLYSPELYTAEQELLLAAHSPMAAVGGNADAHGNAFVLAARQRLRLLDLRDDQIDAVLKSGRPLDDVTVLSPASGVVIEKDVVQGGAVEAGMRVLRIAALSRIWLEADVYERDLASVRLGQAARVQLESRPGQDAAAVISYIYPYVDPATRTGRVRLELENKDLELRPGTYASVLLEDDRGLQLQVPTSAVVYTGPRRLVFVDLGQGRFKPQEVQIGAESGGNYQVLSGLTAGDSVATSGVFLIAAEARISSAAKYWESSAAAAPTDATASLPPMPAAAPTMPTMPTMPTQRVPSAAPTSGPPRRPAVGAEGAPATSEGPTATPPATPSGTAGSSSGSTSSTSSTAKPVIYTCVMHPEIRSPTPGHCPKCGMELVPMAPEAAP